MGDVTLSERFSKSFRAWFFDEVRDLTDDVPSVSPSEWAEDNRYLGQGVTAIPGFFDYTVTPYLREIVDCLDVRSPVREISFRKGSQIGATTGVLENGIGYYIAHASSAPLMMFTADDALAKKRMSKNIIPMINQSGLGEFIQSSDTTNKRKTGRTDKLVEWRGGGSLVPAGAKSAAAMRSDSIQVLLLDEIDGYPLTVGSEGCPVKLAEGRTKGFWQSRKIFKLSTPKIKGTSKIDPEFDRGDQRYFYVPCRGCSKMQSLRFSATNAKGEKYGLVWEMNGDFVKPGSVRYKCEHCGHLHRNADKSFMLPRGEWRPTNPNASPEIRSYQLSSLYAPSGMYDWDAIVSLWLEAWDVVENKVRDTDKLQVFYNTELGMSFEIRGNRVSFRAVSGHRRQYKYGEIPNEFATQHAGSKILVLTCAVDVHDKHLDVAVVGWTSGRRHFVIDYFKFVGDATTLEDDETWGALRALVESKVYTADTGETYRIPLTFVDASYNTDTVVNFCNEYEVGVYPVLGRDQMLSTRASIKEWREWTTQSGTRGYILNVDFYKDRLSAVLRRSWSGVDNMPENFFNAPVDMTKQQITELTVEYRSEKIDRLTGKRLGHIWNRPSGARNELWDLLVYNTAAMEMMASDVCINTLKLASVSYPQFFEFIEQQALYFDS